VENLLSASGKTFVVNEPLQDAVTATIGSGPAYFFRFVESTIDGAKEIVLSENDAKTLVFRQLPVR
jgi:pyrroline-5-carboxylate reductase